MKKKYSRTLTLLSCAVLSSTPSFSAESSDRNDSILIYDEYSRQLESLFVGIDPTLQISPVKNEFHMTNISEECKDSYISSVTGIVRYILDLFRTPKVYAASDCPRSACMGHHITSSYRNCGTGCENQWKGWYHTSNMAPWYLGYRYTGSPACCDYDCRESSCYNGW